MLADADPADKRAIYDELGVNLTYHPDGRVHVGAGGVYLGFVSEDRRRRNPTGVYGTGRESLNLAIGRSGLLRTEHAARHHGGGDLSRH